MAAPSTVDVKVAAEDGDTKPFRELYAEKQARLALLHAKYAPLPQVEIRYDDVSYTLNLAANQADRRIRTVGDAAIDMFLTPVTLLRSIVDKVAGGGPSNTVPFHILNKCSGVIKPGTMSLLLSPPGHGKTNFLRSLAGRVPLDKLTGRVAYSGKTAQELAAAGVQVKQLCSYVDQLDVHLPQLTVRETFAFVHANATVDPALLGHPELEAATRDKVDDVVRLLSLQGCAHTVVGDEMLRGVSGGEKKRVTVGESLVTNARALLMDEISTGLDSAVTFDIVSGLRTWARATSGTVVIALLQPTPEVFALFDEVIMLRDGGVVYHGPREEAAPYFAGLGFSPPTAPAPAPATTTSIAAPPDAAAAAVRQASDAGGRSAEAAKAPDVADWLVDMLTHPGHTFKAGVERRAAEAAAAAAAAAGAPPPLALGKGVVASAFQRGAGGGPEPPVTSELLFKAWRSSALAARLAAAPPSAPPLALEGAFARAQYGRAYPRTFAYHFWALLARQYKLTARNSLFLLFRVVGAIVVALILGTTFFQLSTSVADGFSKYGLFLFAALQVAFANFAEVPIAVQSKYTVYKHLSGGMHPAAAYVLSVVALHIPMAIAESIVFAAILYPMAGLVLDFGRWCFFTLTLFLVDIAMASFFRIFAYSCPDMETAQVAPGPFISIQMLFAGFLITRDKMGWLLFMHYVSLFGYSVRSMAQNEFFAPAYSAALTPGGPSEGVALLQLLDFQTEPQWQWGGIGFMAFFFLVMTALSGVVLSTVRIERNVGTSRGKELLVAAAEGAAAAAAADETEQPLRPSGSSSGGDLAATAGAATPDPASASASNLALSPMSPNPAVLSPEPATYADEAAASPAASGPASKSAVVAVAPPPPLLANSAAGSAVSFTPMTVVFSGIRYAVPIAARKEGAGASARTLPATTKTLLQGVSGYAVPGTITALMGASGAGKTTLLDVIAGRKNSGVMQGSVTVNGFPKEQKAFARLTAYVEQADIHCAYSTVREALEFSAALRLPAAVSAAQRRAFVDEVMEILELNDIADRKIGEAGAADGLSPGQRKRLTIGVELASGAPILFADEPTTGLDSRAAAVVVRVLKRIAQRGRTVITTIHQPAGDLFAQFDSLLLLQRGGWQVFFGPTGPRSRDLVRYLEAIPGTPRCPRRMNPASWMLDVLAGTDSSGEAAVVAAGVAGAGGNVAHLRSAVVPAGAIDASRALPSDTSPGPVDYQAILQASASWKVTSDRLAQLSLPLAGSAPVRFSSLYARGAVAQLRALLHRSLNSYWRNVEYNFVRIMTLIGLHVLFGTIYYQVSATDLSGIQSQVSVQFMTTAFIGVLNMQTALPVLIKERPVFYRERFSFMYGPAPFGIVSFLVELPWLLLVVMTSVPIIYFMVGFHPTAATFFFYALVAWVFTVAFVSLAQAAAAFYSSIAVAQASVNLVVPILFLFGGLFLRQPAIPIGWQWLHWADPITYALDALVAPQFYCAGGVAAGCPTVMVPDPVTQVPAPVDRYQYVAGAFDLNYDNRWNDIGYLCVFIAGFQVLHFVCITFVAHIKR